uniref:70 kDa subunit of replication protein A n=1 Tax=Solanum tuberosum TaxID=4113 RepID=M1BTJ0_SOLTU
MVLRLNIDRIELATRDWICKVQIVEIGRPRESLDKKCRFQIFILEDEEECQIKAVMYADEIGQYADKLKLMNTYFISTAKVKVSLTSYGKPIHKFYWVLDKETVIEHIKPSTELETSLPPPTKLNITTFDRIPHMMVDSAAEIDILAIVVRCGLQKYAGRTHHKCREITICDNQAKANKTMLLGRPSNKTSTSSSAPPMVVTPAGQQVISIAQMSSAASMGLFYVEAEMAISNEFQQFCVLEYSGCKQKKRTKDRKDFECQKCNRKSALVPRYYTFDL